jgi:hypothetical protein
MQRTISLALALCLLSGPVFGQQPLPISRILLYKNGMAYVVRTGEIRTSMNLTFRPDQMNDVLKTFTAWNPATSALYQIGYSTGTGSERLLSRFPFDLRSNGNGLAAFLRQITGARLKLDLSGRSVSGQLLAIVQEDRAVQQATVIKDHRLTVISGGSIQTLWLSDTRSIELEDPDLASQLRAYLEILAEGRQEVTREITIYPGTAAAPSPVSVAYVQQFPLWKTSYRLDLAKGQSRIQGWSQIDNPTGENWDNVDITLVSGMPTSFVMDLYEPLYTERQTVKVPTSVVAGPRRYDVALNTAETPKTANNIHGSVRDTSGAVIPGVEVTANYLPTGAVYSAVTDERGVFEVPNLPAGTFQVSAALPGFQTFRQNVQLAQNGQSSVNAILQVGGTATNVEVSANTVMAQTSSVIVNSLAARRAARDAARAPETQLTAPASSVEAAEAERVEDYYEYRFPFPIRLGSRQSALLPFLNKPIKAEKVSIFKAGADRDHPLNGASIENNADVPLEPGPITFFQDGRYAGETVIEYLSRGERRLVSYGVDYDVQVGSRKSTQPERIAKIKAERGVVTITHEAIQTTSYRFRNKGQDSKTIILEHPRDRGRELKDLKPVETTATSYRFRISAEPGQEIEFPVVETVSRQNVVELLNTERPGLELLFSGSEIPSELRARIDNVIRARERLSELEDQKEPLGEQTKAIFEDQERLRDNLKALGDRREERELRQRYIAELQSQEEHIKDLRNKLDVLNRQIAEQDAMVDQLIANFSWE